eukprot:tig00000269_g23733.t1
MLSPASGERAEDPERVDPRPAKAAPAPSQTAAAASIDTLPDDVVSNVFKALGLRESWPLRIVCRRWRRVVEETEWADFDLWYAYEAGSTSTPACSSHCDCAYCMASDLFEKGKLRLSERFSVTLRPWLYEFVAQAAGNKRTVAAACNLLAAMMLRSAQPREASVMFLNDHDETGLVLGDSSTREIDPDLFSSYLLDVLRALQPREGAPSALESLSVGFSGGSCVDAADHDNDGYDDYIHSVMDEMPAGCVPWPPAAELHAALIPFRGLRSLTLLFDDFRMAVSSEAATVIAATCPLLRSVAVSLRPFRESSDAVLAALARLAHLEELALVVVSCTRSAALSDPAYSVYLRHGLLELAEGPAGQSLRKIVFAGKNRLLGDGVFPRGFTAAELAPAQISDGATLAALGRMPKLEVIAPLEIHVYDTHIDPSSILAFGCAENLRSTRLSVVFNYHPGVSPERARAGLDALCAALSGLPRLENLALDLQYNFSGCTFASASSSAAANDILVTLLTSAGVRRALTDLKLDGLFRAPGDSRALANAIAALPRLARLALREMKWGYTGSSDDFAAFLGSEGVRRVLTDFACGWPLSEAGAGALFALPALQRLRLSAGLDPAAPLPLRTFEDLNRRLGPEVAVQLALTPRNALYPWGSPELEDLREAVEGVFDGRPPF